MNKTIFYTLLSTRNPKNEKEYMSEKFNLDTWIEESDQYRQKLRKLYPLLKSGDTLIVKSLREIVVHSPLVTILLLLLKDRKVDVISLSECFNSKLNGWEQTVKNSVNLYDSESISVELYKAFVSKSKELKNLLNTYKIPAPAMKFLPEPMDYFVNLESHLELNSIKKPMQKKFFSLFPFFGDKVKH